MNTWVTSGGQKILQVLAGRSNAFLVTSGKEKILIDTGPGFMWKILKKRLHRLGVWEIDLLILTHSHFDHAANAARIKKYFNARVMVHKSEAQYLMKGDNILPAGTNLFSQSLVKLFANRFRSLAMFEPCNPDLLADDLNDLSEFGIDAYIMHTPGHTEGSISVIVENEIALVGDTMFGIFRKSVFPPFANDVPRMLQSWSRLLSTRSRIFIPSHGTANSRILLESDYRKRIG